MICYTCGNLHFALPDDGSAPAAKHHGAFRDLINAANEGCELCTVFKSMYIKACIDEGLDLSEEYVVQMSLQQDIIDNTKVESDPSRSGFFVLVTGYISNGSPSSLLGGIYGITFIRYPRCGDFLDREMVGISLEVSVTDQETRISPENKVVGRVMEKCPNLILARQWIAECVQNHVGCKQEKRSSTMPTRIIDLGSGGTQDLRLIITDYQGVEDYVALSHCWGDHQPLTTTVDTLADHRNKIPIGALPNTFRDAVKATRELGYRYLWIDSLCIIQDSTEDWERECPRMVEIYRNAVVTLAAVDAPNSNAGFLGERILKNMVRIDVNWTLEGQNNFISGIIWVSTDEREFEYLVEPNAPLTWRAWAFQERLLSTRGLSVSSKKMYFECLTHMQFEDLHVAIVTDPDQAQMDLTVEKRSFTTFKDRKECYDYWYRIVSDYSSKRLTFQSDKLPALSGIAAAMHSNLDEGYIAGLWQRDIARGLSWQAFTPGDGSPIRMHKISINYVAPSWSWAAVGQSFFYVYSEPSLKFSSLLKVVDAEAIVPGDNPFGQVVYGELKVQGRLKLGKVRRSTLSWILYASEDDFEGGTDENEGIGKYHPDSSPPGGWQTVIQLFLLELGRVDFPDGKQLCAIAVERSPSNRSDGLEEYRRTGIVVIENKDRQGDMDGGSQSKTQALGGKLATDWFEGSGYKTVVLI